MKRRILAIFITALTLIPVLTFLNWIKHNLVYGDRIRSGALYYPFYLQIQLPASISLIAIETIILILCHWYFRNNFKHVLNWHLGIRSILSGLIGYLGTTLSVLFLGGLPFKQFIPLFFTGMLFPVIYRWIQKLFKSEAG